MKINVWMNEPSNTNTGTVKFWLNCLNKGYQSTFSLGVREENNFGVVRFTLKPTRSPPKSFWAINEGWTFFVLWMNDWIDNFGWFHNSNQLSIKHENVASEDWSMPAGRTGPIWWTLIVQGDFQLSPKCVDRSFPTTSETVSVTAIDAGFCSFSYNGLIAPG